MTMEATSLKIKLNRNISYSCTLEVARGAKDGVSKVWVALPVFAKALEEGENRKRHARGWVCSEQGRVS